MELIFVVYKNGNISRHKTEADAVAAINQSDKAASGVEAVIAGCELRMVTSRVRHVNCLKKKGGEPKED